jgi:hypothetical protein
MSAPDFYFASQAIFRHIHDSYGKEALVDYWRALAREYYRKRIEAWRRGGLAAVASDWRSYFANEPLADVQVIEGSDEVALEIRVCPAIRHLREQERTIVPYFCEHCDHTCGVMADAARLSFHREGGMGTCRQVFARLDRTGQEPM